MIAETQWARWPGADIRPKVQHATAYFIQIKMRVFSRMLVGLAVFLFLLAAVQDAHAEKLTIVAAADLKFALDEVVVLFKQTHPTDQVETIYGSSGKFKTQIQQGAPYDMFFSADIAYPQELVSGGFAASEVRAYAVGRIVLWSATRDGSKMTLNDLTDPSILKIAIANPKHAPYGKRAEQALRAAGVWDKIETKLVYGENVVQAAQFVQSGNAQIGIIAMSLALSPELAKLGSYTLLPENLYQPLEQGFIITRRAADSQLAKAFARYMTSNEVRSIMVRYGFVLPGDVK